MADTEKTAQLLERASRLIQNQGTAEGLNPVQWETLRYFSRANRFSCSPSALTDYLGVTKGTVSQTINAMQRKGLLKKGRVPGDARAVDISLTLRGKQLLKRNPLQHLSEDLKELPAKNIEQLNSSLSHIIESALKRRGGSAFGMCQSCKHFDETHENGNPHRCALLEVPLTAHDASLICREYQAVS